MIQVVIKENHQQILDIKISGHANSDERGKDLVCAGVTISCVGVANALVKNHFLDRQMGSIDIQKGFAHIEVNQSDSVVQVILETFVTILETIEDTQSKYIKNTKMEV